MLTDRVTATLLEVVQSNDSDDTEIRRAQRYLDLGSKQPSFFLLGILFSYSERNIFILSAA